MEDAIRKADVLIEALPYIKEFHRKVMVIKYGGSILGDEKNPPGGFRGYSFLKLYGFVPGPGSRGRAEYIREDEAGGYEDRVCGRDAGY